MKTAAEHDFNGLKEYRIFKNKKVIMSIW